MTQQELNALLDTSFTIPVEIRTNTFPDNIVYPQLNDIDQKGFAITGRELLHVIGSKTAALPANYQDECIHSAYKFAHLLDFEGEYLGYRQTVNLDSDIQTNTSNEIGVGVGCLIANKLFNVDWDTLESIRGRGVKFDYRATNPGQNYVYEFKGTKYRRNQNRDIAIGLSKKQQMHGRNESYDIELIISTHLGYSDQVPRIILADPPFEGFKNEFTQLAEIVYSLRHLARVAQFMGNIQMSRVLYVQSRMFETETEVSQIEEWGGKLLKQQLKSRESRKILERITTVNIQNTNFIGRWVSDWIPEKKTSKRNYTKLPDFYDKRKIEVFQGVSIDLYKIMSDSSFAYLKGKLKFEQRKFQSDSNIEFTVFGDGTVMAFRLV